MNKAVILDRDGTINIDKGYVYRKEDFVFLPDTLMALKRLQQHGYKLIIISNQSGIARGYYKEEDYLELNQWLIKELKKNGVVISATYYCPHLKDGVISKYRIECNCRKPRTRLFYQAIEEFDIDIQNSYAIGDKERDVTICKETSLGGFVLYTEKEQRCGNISYITGGLDQATNIILKREYENE